MGDRSQEESRIQGCKSCKEVIMKIYKASTGREISRTTEILCAVFGIVLIGLALSRNPKITVED